MKIFLLLLIITSTQVIFAQQSYYDDVDITLTGQNLYFELQNKIDIDNNTFNYGDMRDAFLVTDEDPNNNNNVLLIYGYNDNDSNCTTDRTRDKVAFGGNNCEYNREHVFAKSLANPDMGSVSNSTTGIGADPHNLRSSDVQSNNNRGSKKFGSGSGNAGDVGSGNWYPGDEWKGDVARMMMYMYTRYGDRCLPSLVGVGSTQGSTEMLQMFIQWNVDDPVSIYEDQRNPYTESNYGNRNPFIDNPYLATVIWGGPQAEDRWGILSTTDNEFANVLIYPNPASETLWVENTTSFVPKNYVLYDISGRRIIQKNINSSRTSLDVSNLSSGLYILELTSKNKKIIKKITVQ